MRKETVSEVLFMMIVMLIDCSLFTVEVTLPVPRVEHFCPRLPLLLLAIIYDVARRNVWRDRHHLELDEIEVPVLASFDYNLSLTYLVRTVGGIPTSTVAQYVGWRIVLEIRVIRPRDVQCFERSLTE